jgi:oxygen-dependent protoporphyrinogen oxidase
LGAGLTGLATAWFIKKGNPSLHVTLLEKSERAGGWIQTIRKEGFLFELGPRGFRPQGHGLKTKQLCQELSLDREWAYASSHAKKRYLWHEGVLVSVTPWMLLKQLKWKGLLNDLRHSAGELPDESIASFFSRHFHSTFTSRIISPCLQGIFGGPCQQLSVKSCLPIAYEWQTQQGSLLKALLKKKEILLPPPHCSLSGKEWKGFPKLLPKGWKYITTL